MTPKRLTVAALVLVQIVGGCAEVRAHPQWLLLPLAVGAGVLLMQHGGGGHSQPGPALPMGPAGTVPANVVITRPQ